ncbi:MAG: ATP-binding protein [Clostridia bacterium]|nr:ATP-binding protein [Clostridia bacterium]
MGYSKSIYITAQSKLDSRRKKAVEELEIRRAKAYSAIPELVEIQSRIAACGAEVIGAFAKGANGRAYVEELAKESLAAQKRRKELLAQAGLPENYLEAQYVCNICEDTGVTDDGICECQRKLLAETAKDEISKHAPLRASTFEKFSLEFYPEAPDANGISPKKRMGEIAKFCKDYANDFSLSSASLFMHGATGLGKTHLSLSIANVVTEKGMGVIYSSAPNLFGELEREHFSRQNPNERTFERELLETDLLIIDDLGVEFSTQFTVSCVYNIINSRILSGKPTIISTNLTPGELEDKYTQRITSRIIGSYISIKFIGRDIRQLKRY